MPPSAPPGCRELQGGEQVFEDVHWADAATLDLLKYLGRRIRSMATLIVLTYRDDELDGSHALWSVLGDLPSSAVRRMHLEPLSAAAVARLARRAGRSAEEVHSQTGGNPFCVTELLASPPGSVPVTVRDATLARALRLSPQSERGLLRRNCVVDLVDEVALVGAALQQCRTRLQVVRRHMLKGGLIVRGGLAMGAQRRSLPGRLGCVAAHGGDVAG